MKNLLQIFITVVFIFGMVQYSAAYTCNDDIVKNQATELYRDLLEEQCYDFNSVIALYGRETVRYALLQEGQEEKLLRLERICKKKNIIKTEKLTIINIKTINIDKSTLNNKYYCSGKVKFNSDILDINYTFQHTDDEKDVWVTFQKSNI